MLVFATLGPTGSNHELVTRRYLALHGLDAARISLVADFGRALELMSSGQAQFIVQAAVHPEAATTVARARFRHDIHVVDTFISPSRPLAVLSRAEVAAPATLGLQPATRDYVDTSRWATLVPEPSIVVVAEGLLAGRYDSGLTALDLARDHPGRFRIDTELGTIDDPWIVLGRPRIAGDGLLAWPDSPASRLYRATAGAGG